MYRGTKKQKSSIAKQERQGHNNAETNLTNFNMENIGVTLTSDARQRASSIIIIIMFIIYKYKLPITVLYLYMIAKPNISLYYYNL